MTNVVVAQPTVNRRYQVLEQIGAGGMGAVYRAADRLTGQQVALKKLQAPSQQLIFLTGSEGVNLRLALAQEFRSLASLRHPNIISVLDYGFDQTQQPFFTMELLEGGLNLL